MKALKSIAVLLAVVVTFGLAAFGLNFLTEPIIKKNNAGAELKPLLAVMPEGSSFDGNALIYSSDKPSASSLADVGEEVLKIYKESTGKGYAIQYKTVGNYEPTPMKLTFGVSSEGVICGLQVDEYTDSIDVTAKDPNFLASFIGKDSALADVNLVSGCTYSSASIKNAVSAGLNALIANELITAGQKSPEQALTELIPTVHPGMTKLSEVTASGNVFKGFKAGNDAGFAYIMTEGNDYFLAVVNGMGGCKVYNVDGTDVTADKTALVTEATTAAAGAQKSYESKATNKFAKMVGADAASTTFNAIQLDVFNTVVYAASFEVEGSTYYGFFSRSFGFEQMDVYVVLDSDGKIVKLDADAIFFHEEYFDADDNVDISAYKGGFTGLDKNTFTGDNAMITGATMTSNAVKTSTNDAFAAFDSLELGGAE